MGDFIDGVGDMEWREMKSSRVESWNTAAAIRGECSTVPNSKSHYRIQPSNQTNSLMAWKMAELSLLMLFLT